MAYQAPIADQMFVLKEVLALESFANLPKFADAPIDLVEQIVEEGAKFCENVLAPLNKVGDTQGCTWRPDNTVTVPDGFKDAYKQLVETGFPALAADPAHGGQGLPSVVNVAFSEASSSANMAFSMFPGLTSGNYAAIAARGSDEQKATYCAKLASGEWSGTMNLTEPHCGTDLGLLRTKAVPHGDGTYRISGQKIWISAGEHDVSENIIHLVLARIEGAPPGVKGISLFIVPKYLPKADGSPGARNEGVKCAGLEHKMGIHGNPTCVMAYDDAIGYLIGEENGGLSIMFIMMNEARLWVGLQGLSQAEAAYQAAVTFAKERLQGRSLTGPKNPDGPADPIIVHADVRRMLLESKATIEGMRALLYWTILQEDLAHVHPDEAMRQKAGDLVGLMTPICKAYLTDKGFDIASLAMQVHGGSGFTEHFPASQYLRDSRITMIYEGTNGIQALDLVGRKLPAKGGRAAMALLAELNAVAADAGDDPAVAPYVEALNTARERLQDGAGWLMQNAMANPDNAGAGSVDFLRLVTLAGLAMVWVKSAKAFYANKLATGRYFLERIAPEGALHLTRLKTGADALMALPADAF